MRFRILGLDAVTGRPRELFVDADSRGEAITQARQQGVQPESVTTASDLAPPPVHKPNKERAADSSSPSYPALRIIAIGYQVSACLVAVVAIIGFLYGFDWFITRTGAEKDAGLIVALMFAGFGAIGVISQWAIAEAIQLAINIATDVRAMRDKVTQDKD